MRPDKLSGDFTPTRDVVLHAINWFESRGEKFENICCLYPTSVLLEYDDLEKAFEKLSKSNINAYVFSAAKYAHIFKGFLFR